MRKIGGLVIDHYLFSDRSLFEQNKKQKMKSLLSDALSKIISLSFNLKILSSFQLVGQINFLGLLFKK